MISAAKLGAASLLLNLLLVGCGTPAAPAPPSLDLPEPVANLTVTRAGDRLTFSWAQPKRNTDKLLLKGDVDVKLCRCGAQAECAPIDEVYVSPGKDKRVDIALPSDLASGEPRPVAFAVNSFNRMKRSAGLSNKAWVIAGAAPNRVEGLAVKQQRQGAALSWQPQPGAQQAVRLIRRRLSAPLKPKPQSNTKALLGPPDEPETMSFLVDEGNGGKAIDRTARVGESYEYTAERVVRVKVKEETLELKSGVSAAAKLDVHDIYPPSSPEGLVAVASGEEGQRAIDLSWQPSISTGLVSPVAGYIVYRREGGEGEWERVSGVGLVSGPAFNDANVSVGHSYSYAVSAVGVNTLVSAKSEVATEAVE